MSGVRIGRMQILESAPFRRNPRKNLLCPVLKKFLRPLAYIFWAEFKILDSLYNFKYFLLLCLSQLVR